MNRNTIDMPTIKTKDDLANSNDYQQPKSDSNSNFYPQNNVNIDKENISKTKIININDFIFRQNLEFYPNLEGLSCKNNTLLYQEDNKIIASEVLTFDLRTLPGEVWNQNHQVFMSTIKLNKDCKKLQSFLELINRFAYDNFLIPQKENEMYNEQLKNIIERYMEIYFKLKDSFNLLTEDNKILINRLENMIACLPDNSYIKDWIDNKIDNYYADTKNLSKNSDDSLEKTNFLTLVRIKDDRSKNTSLLEEKEPNTKAGFINVAILLYGIINIGMILAMAFLK